MRDLPHTGAEDVLELIMRRYERVHDADLELPVDDWANCSATPPG